MKRAIIIGNGFDLALGAKTSFKDFLLSPQYMNISASNSLKQYYTELNRVDENWCDLEGSLKGWGDWFDDFKHKLDRENKTAARAQARSHFKEMQNAIQTFVAQNSSAGIMHNEVIGVEMLVNAWHCNSNAIVYNFNYTGLYQEYLLYVAKKRSFTPNWRPFHMHGTLEQRNALFGTTEDVLPADLRFAAKVVAAEEVPSFDYFLKYASEIEIFGHSLGSSDWNYLRHLFVGLIEMGSSAPKVRIYTRSRNDGQTIRENLSNMKSSLFSDLTNMGRAPRFHYVDELFSSRYSQLHELIENEFKGVRI